MDFLISVFVAIYGAFLGSFYNVIAFRILRGESIVTLRSHCLSCKRVLSAAELCPIFSYLFLCGKCRNCGVSISPLYCIFEIITAVGFVISYWKYGLSGSFVLSVTFVSLVVIGLLSNIRYKRISNQVLLVFFVLFFIEQFFLPTMVSFYDACIGVAVGFFMPKFIESVSCGKITVRNHMLYGVFGLAMGWQFVFLFLFFAVLFRLFYGIYQRMTNVFQKQQEILLSPFLAAMVIFIHWFGEHIIFVVSNFYKEDKVYVWVEAFVVHLF